MHSTIMTTDQTADIRMAWRSGQATGPVVAVGLPKSWRIAATVADIGFHSETRRSQVGRPEVGTKVLARKDSGNTTANTAASAVLGLVTTVPAITPYQMKAKPNRISRPRPPAVSNKPRCGRQAVNSSAYVSMHATPLTRTTISDSTEPG